jgi:hypothetical protein
MLNTIPKLINTSNHISLCNSWVTLVKNTWYSDTQLHISFTVINSKGGM